MACAALASQPLVSPVAPMTASCAGTAVGILDQLKHQLLIAVEKVRQPTLHGCFVVIKLCTLTSFFGRVLYVVWGRLLPSLGSLVAPS